METGKDLIDIENNYVRADAGKRFLNYLIDMLIFYGIVFGIFFAIAVQSPETIDSMSEDSNSFGLGERVFALIAYAVYMGIMETVWKGKSLGKFITGTRAVNLDGSPLSVGTAFGRGFSRAVPFCVFSAFGTPCDPWQDKWTNTMVIDERKSRME